MTDETVPTEAPRDDSPQRATSPKCDAIDAKDQYFKALSLWLDQTLIAQNTLASIPYHMMVMGQRPMIAGGSFGGLPQPPTAAELEANRLADIATRYNFGMLRNPWRDVDPTVYTSIIRETGGFEFKTAPVWKRLVAELIDFIIIIIIKMILVDKLDLRFYDENSIFDSYLNINDIDYQADDFLSVYTTVIYTEIGLKTVICLYEALWTCSTSWYTGGATPGKLAMGLRVLYVEGIAETPDGANEERRRRRELEPETLWSRMNPAPCSVLAYPATTMTFRRALCRAIMKNVLLLPLWVLVTYRDNRTTYDVAVRTLVVDQRAGPAPAFRRL